MISDVNFKTPLKLKLEILTPELLALLGEEPVDTNTQHTSDNLSDFGVPVAEDTDVDSLYFEENDDLTSPPDTGKSITEKSEKLNEKNIKFIHAELLAYEHRLVETFRILKLISDQLDEKTSRRDPTSLREIFKDIPSLYFLHQHLLSQLEDLNCQSDNRQFLPAVFVSDSEIPYLNIYKSFMSHFAINYPKLSLLAIKDKDFQQICRSAIESSPNPEQRLQDVSGMYYGVNSSLIRFKLLVSRMQSCFSDDDDRLKDVQKTLSVFGQLLTLSEDEVMKQDRIKDAHEIFGKLEGLRLDCQQIPQLLREGPCRKISRRSTQKRLLDRHLFLFSDYLVLAEPANTFGRFKVKSEAPLKRMTVTDLCEDDDIKFPHCLRIKTRVFCIEVKFSNEGDKSAWLEEFKQVIVHERGTPKIVEDTFKNEPSVGTEAAEWVKDEQSTMCAYCHSAFTFLNRKHHCRACGKVFCGTCSAYQAPIAFSGGKLSRVCVVDYYLIHQDLKPPNFQINAAIQQRLQTGSAHNLSSHENGYLSWSLFNTEAWSSKPLFPTCKHTFHSITVSSTPSQNNRIRSSRNMRSFNRRLSTSALKTSRFGSYSPVNSPVPSHCNVSVCLSRVFSVLGTDSKLSIFAAKADNLAKDSLTLVGGRLVYMDTSDSIQRTSSRNGRASSYISIDNCSSKSGLINRKPYNTVEAQLNHQPVTHSSDVNQPQYNALYRQVKPPIGPKPTTAVLAAAYRKMQVVKSQTQKKSENAVHTVRRRSKSIPAMLDIISLPNSTNDRKCAAEFEIASISPAILAILRNRLGFLLLPPNSNCPAHYFETPSVEIRTRWLRAIRDVCLKSKSP